MFNYSIIKINFWDIVFKILEGRKDCYPTPVFNNLEFDVKLLKINIYKEKNGWLGASLRA